MRRFAACLLFPLALLVAAGCNSPTQAELEKSVREEMKSKLDVTITSFDLKKQDNGTYAGTATADNGDIYDITTEPAKDGKISWKAVWALPTVERKTQQLVETAFKNKVASLKLTKQEAADTYAGPVEMESGLKMNITVEMKDGQLKLVDVKFPEVPPAKGGDKKASAG